MNYSIPRIRVEIGPFCSKRSIYFLPFASYAGVRVSTAEGVKRMPGQRMTLGRRDSMLRRTCRAYRKQYDLFLLFLPVIAFYIIFHYIPMYGILIAFKKYNMMLGFAASKWVGLANFQKFLSSPSFREVLTNTVLIGAYKILFGFPTPIILAILLSEARGRVFKRTVQTISYLPHFLSWVVLAGIFVQFLSPHNGFVNQLLRAIGLKEVYFLGDPAWFRSTLVMTSIWQTVGWGSIIYLAAISGINPELYEAAVIDGAGRWKQAIHITLPTLTSLIVMQLILRIGRMMSLGFEKIILLYTPLTYETADVISSYIYRRGLQEANFSLGTAIGIFNSAINLLLLFGANTLSRKIAQESLW